MAMLTLGEIESERHALKVYPIHESLILLIKIPLLRDKL